MTIIDQYEAAVDAGNWDEALQLAEQIAESTPDFPGCWFNVGDCQDALDRNMDAARSFQRVIANDFWDARARFRMLRSLYLANAIQIVHDELTMMLRHDPGFVKELSETETFQDLFKEERFALLLQDD